MDQLRIGLIGAGRISAAHAKSIDELPELTLQRVCDPVVENAERLAALYGGTVSSDPADVLGAGDVDAVIIASPTPTHVDLLNTAIAAGLPTLCEKPIDLDLARVDSLRAAAAAASAPVVLGFNRRFDPHFAGLHRRVTAGDIGRLEQLAITSRDPAPAPRAYIESSGGIFRDMTIHDFDMARFFVPDIVEVTARGANQFSDDIRELGDFDAVVVVLSGADGEQITITNSRRAVYGYDQRLEAFGSDGLLTVGNITDTAVRHWSGTAVESLEPYQNFFLERYADAYRLELQEFAKAARGEPNRAPGFEDGRSALVLADAAEESARTGRTVRVSTND